MPSLAATKQQAPAPGACLAAASICPHSVMLQNMTSRSAPR
jgi:hypothetical protein